MPKKPAKKSRSAQTKKEIEPFEYEARHHEHAERSKKAIGAKYGSYPIWDKIKNISDPGWWIWAEGKTIPQLNIGAKNPAETVHYQRNISASKASPFEYNRNVAALEMKAKDWPEYPPELVEQGNANRAEIASFIHAHKDQYGENKNRHRSLLSFLHAEKNPAFWAAPLPHDFERLEQILKNQKLRKQLIADVESGLTTI